MADQENSIKAARERYNQNVERALKRGGERRERFATTSGIEIKRLYGPDDLENFDYLSDLGFPGEYPFTRGVQPTMYRGRLWTMRQYAGFGTAEESNRRYRYLLEQGQTGLSVAFDLPTQMGRDPDHPLARGEVGRVGVAISSLSDMETLLADLPLDKISTSMTINATASILLALYLVVAEKQGVSWDKLNGTIQNDILKEYVARGTYIYPPRPSMRIITDIFEFATKEVPNWNTISISGYHIREAGSTAVQELAFTLADGIAYVDAALKAGLDVDAFAARLSFFFNVHNNFFEEIAKFRAARRLWARIMKERFKARDTALDDAALPRPDRGDDADRPAGRKQRRAGGGAGAGGGDGRGAIAAHQFQGRGAGAAHRKFGATGAANPAGDRLRIGSGGHDRSDGGLLLRRKPDPGTGRRRRANTWRASTIWAARWRQSSAALCSARFRTPPSTTSARSKPNSASSSASTSLPAPKPSPSIS